MKEMPWWKGILAIILGLLILANAYWEVVDWASFIGIILVICGFLKLVIPCKHKK